MTDLSKITTEELEIELRRRRLMETTCLGMLQITDGGKKAEFGLSSVPWPDGKYKIAIKCLEDLTYIPVSSDSDPDQTTEINNESQK